LDCQCRLVSDFLLDFLTSHRPGRHQAPSQLSSPVSS
jgi:hypothetical protein